MYREVGLPQVMQPKPQIDSLPVAGSSSSPDNNLLNAIPKGVGLCKTFDELRLYWTENYNVKVANAVAKLNFESVRAAMSGVEAVLEEFLPAGFFLKEFDVYPIGLMSTSRGHGKIYFNPEYFSNVEKLKAEITVGVETRFYPKNMTAVGVGAHEAGHIIEDWLIEKYGLPKDVSLRTAPTGIIVASYGDVLRSLGRFRPLDEFREEICTHAAKYNMSECLSNTLVDYMTNGRKAEVLSRAVWQRLKEELSKMMSYSESELAKIPMVDFKKYGIFDKWGTIIGVKEDAPPEFKEAYEHDKKIEEEREALGLD